MRVFWPTAVTYDVWLLTTCCLNACFLYSGHSLYDEICGHLHFGFLASLFGHSLWEWLSLQIRHFCFDLQFLAEWPNFGSCNTV